MDDWNLFLYTYYLYFVKISKIHWYHFKIRKSYCSFVLSLNLNTIYTFTNIFQWLLLGYCQILIKPIKTMISYKCLFTVTSMIGLPACLYHTPPPPIHFLFAMLLRSPCLIWGFWVQMLWAEVFLCLMWNIEILDLST